MTEEEKLLESERLFVLFDRMARTGVMEVENPVRKARDDGKLVETRDEERAQLRKALEEEERIELEVEREMRVFREKKRAGGNVFPTTTTTAAARKASEEGGKTAVFPSAPMGKKTSEEGAPRASVFPSMKKKPAVVEKFEVVEEQVDIKDVLNEEPPIEFVEQLLSSGSPALPDAVSREEMEAKLIPFQMEGVEAVKGKEAVATGQVGVAY